MTKPASRIASGREARIEPLEPRQLCAASLLVLASLGTTADPLESQSGIAVDAVGDVYGTEFRYGATEGATFRLPAGATAADGTITASARRVAAVTRRVKVGAGGSVQLSLPITAAPSTAGDYSLVARVTDGSGRSTTSPVGAVLDVLDHFMSLQTSVANVARQVTAGGPVDFTLRVTNSGNQAMTDGAQLDIELSDAVTQARVFVATVNRSLKVPAGRTVTLAVRTSLPATTPPGVYLLVVSVAQGSVGTTATGTSPLTVVG